MADYPVTRAAAMELSDEQQLIRQGYDFLDEKRILLASETMRQLTAWKTLKATYEDAMAKARAALARALMQHGLEELQVHPAVVAGPVQFDTVSRNFLGVPLVEIQLRADEGIPDAGKISKAEACGLAFRALSRIAAEMAAVSGNLLRLAAEYRRTERRARALENVLLPEISNALKMIEEQLEATDLEEAVRVRRTTA
ncbi:MAG: V-type ATP synthase subunit D [Alphaproteobacteria bacterium]|nr:V-type ATP synthase subunit D [Alphaproteobacteria bacterium]